METAADKDFYFFYVASPDKDAQINIGLSAFGGGTLDADLTLTLIDSAGTRLSGIPFVRIGEARSLQAGLSSGKYFLEVVQTQGVGGSYQVVGTGSSTAFVSHSAIASRCAKTTTDVARATIARRHAQSRLERLLGRLRRSRYASTGARHRSLIAYRKARRRLGTATSALGQARGSRFPWCAIPE